MTELAYVRVSPKWWPANPGAVLVIPRAHHENLYDLPAATGHAVRDLIQVVATAIRGAYACEGTSIREHNEPAGNQDVWHLHVHVFPRFDSDQLYPRHREAAYVAAEERRPYADLLAQELGLPRIFDPA